MSTKHHKQSGDLFSTLKETAALGIGGFRDTVTGLLGGSSNSVKSSSTLQGVSSQGQISHSLENWERSYIKETGSLHG